MKVSIATTEFFLNLVKLNFSLAFAISNGSSCKLRPISLKILLIGIDHPVHSEGCIRRNLFQRAGVIIHNLPMISI